VIDRVRVRYDARMTIHSLALAALLLSVPSAPPAPASEPPSAPQAPGAPTKTAEKASPKQEPVYDEGADAAKAIDAAIARAARNNTRVLVQWGANWCGWCRLLHRTFKSDAAVAKELRYEYELVLVDVGRFDRNMALAEKYGADLKQHGLPYLTVIAADGKAIANQETGSLEKPKDAQPGGHDSAKVMAFLTQHQAPALKADDVLAAAVTKANADGKLVLLHFGAPWCGWCHRLEDWMAAPEVSAILSKAFVDVKVDTDRMTGGAELLRVHSQGQNGGIPWCEILDAGGEALVNSNAPGSGNIGFPAKPEEIAWFMTMLAKSGAKLSDDDRAALERSLVADAKPRG